MSIDYRIFSIINSLAGKSSLLDKAMIMTSKYMPLLYGVVLLLLWLQGTRRSRRAAVYSVVSALLALALAQITGMIYFRPRPFASHSVNLLISHSPDPSFPSDHATGSSALAAGIAGGSAVLGRISWIMCLLLSFSRVYVGVHYPSDVLAGILFGLLSYQIVYRTAFITRPLVDYCIEKAEGVLSLIKTKTPGT